MSDESVSALEADPVVTTDDAVDPASPAQAEPPAEDAEVSAAKARRERQKQARERAEAELERAKSEAEDAKRRHQKLLDVARGDAPPTEADFPDPLELAAASAHWKMSQRSTAREAQDAEKLVREAQDKEAAAERARMDAIGRDWADQITSGRQRYADFDAIALNQAIPIPPPLALMVATSENGADLAYHLGKNPQLAERLARLNPVDAAREIGRIEARLDVPQPRHATQAPEPITPVRGSASVSKRPEDMNATEFAAWRAAGGTF